MNGPFREAIRTKSGKLVALTAQSESGADEARATGQLGYDVVSDPSNELARHFGVAITPKAQSPLAEHPTEYPQGMAQPAVIALGNQGEVLSRWAIDPSEMNLGGASDRPLPVDLLEVINAKLPPQDIGILEADSRQVDLTAR